MGNLTGIRVGCVSAHPSLVSLASLDQQLYAGFATRIPGTSRTAAAGGAQEYINAYEVRQLTSDRLNVTVRFNDTTQVGLCLIGLMQTSIHARRHDVEFEAHL
jgi:hypothetical protein